MGFGDLPAKNQTNTGATLLRGEEGHKQIGSIGKSRTIVDNPQLDLPTFTRPANLNLSFGFQRRVGSVPVPCSPRAAATFGNLARIFDIPPPPSA